MQRVVCEFGFDGNPLGDVAIHDDEFLDFAATVLDSAGRRLERAPFAILMTKTVLQAPTHPGSASFASGFEDFETVVGMNLLEDRSSGQLFGGISQDSFVRG